MIQSDIEAHVDGIETFSMRSLHEHAWPKFEALAVVSPLIEAIRAKLGPGSFRSFADGILRHSFLIELVKVPKIDSTKFRTRWNAQLAGDPRGASFDDCLAIAIGLTVSLVTWLENAENEAAFRLSTEHGNLPYELPLDYAARHPASGRIHEPGNLIWFRNELTLRTLKLRHLLLTSAATSPDVAFFRALRDKVRTKSYLTDRVLTGGYKTNREKRWEAHPQSVHFATRVACMEIEYALTTAVCGFENFPVDAVLQLQAAGVIPNPLLPFVCPITGDPLSFTLMRQELLVPNNGKSSFHVGHLTPLKLDAGENGAAGHLSSNISWISEDGNRIQGSLSVKSVRDLIFRITANHQKLGWWPDQK